MTPSPDRDFSMWTPGLFDLFRILLGIYLASHFVGLLLWGTELFSSAGMIADAGLSPLYALVPNIFWLGDSPLFVLLVIASGVVAAVAMVLKQCDRVAAIWILLVLISLFCRNPLIANPGMAPVGGLEADGWMARAAAACSSWDTSRKVSTVLSIRRRHADWSSGVSA